MSNIEKNVSESFRRVKQDIVRLQNQVLQLTEIQNQLSKKIESIDNKSTLKSVRTIVPSIVKAKQKHFIASKTGEKFHIPECIFTKNIKPKSMLRFKSKNTALNAGYKPCDCVK
jgi:hypothetical protein